MAGGCLADRNRRHGVCLLLTVVCRLRSIVCSLLNITFHVCSLE